MKITFFSNFLNHHQRKLCEAFQEICKGEFRFVACEPIESERVSMGYKDMNQEPYVIRAYEGNEQMEEALQWCLTSDIVIHGSADEIFVTKRMELGLPTFRYSERILKRGLINVLSPRIQKLIGFRTGYRNKPLYLLCSSAYTAMDFHRFGAYRNKAYRWGYFPDVKRYSDIDSIFESKKKNSLLWVGRYLEWKHPEAAIEVAERLKKDGYNFTLTMIGTGPIQARCERLVKQKELSDVVRILGAMPPEEVRTYMEKSEIYLFTSDRREGWGAVLNESMNSACAVVASHAIGSVPFLIKDGENGLIYRNGCTCDLYEKVKSLLDDSAWRKEIGRVAYDTLCNQWNAEEAAKRFVQLAQAICNGEEFPDLFKEDVCSKAPLLKDGWYK